MRPEVGLFPGVLERLGRFDRPVLVDTRRKSRLRGPVSQLPRRAYSLEETRVSQAFAMCPSYRRRADTS